MNNIPQELKERAQWVVWREQPHPQTGAITKPPFNPHTGNLASPGDLSTCATFEIAKNCLANGGGFAGLGYMLSSDDPYSIIDLDTYKDYLTDEDRTRHQKIAETFKGYAEVSPSGKGLHLIVKGKVPCNRSKGGVQLLTERAYATMTGNAWRNEPIEDQSQLLNILWAEMEPESEKANALPMVNQEQIYSDEQILEQASKAANGELFKNLWEGKWNLNYPSQSEADFALIDILGFYSKNIEQIKRLFRMSALGQRPKAWRNHYLENMIAKSQDNRPPSIDISALRCAIEQSLKQPKMEPIPKVEVQNDIYALPPGLLGEIAFYIFQAAPRPVPEIALAAAIGLMSGICGRAYNISETGLNNYLVLLAPTGTGKEGMASGIAHLMNEVTKNVPAAIEFLGPEAIRSDAALLKYIAKRNSFLTIVGEFDNMLESMTAKNSSSHAKSLKHVLLNLYAKSGRGNVLRPTIYSSSEESTNAIISPAFSLLGETTPESFYELLDEKLIRDGLLTRFTIIEYKGLRPALNPYANVMPTKELVQKVSSLCAYALTLNNTNACVSIQFQPDAKKIMDEFDTHCTDHINSPGSNEVTRHIWNRAHLRALKLSALLSIGLSDNYYNPIVNKTAAEWGIRISYYNTKKLLEKFDTGEVGSNVSDNKQVNEVIRVVRDYIVKDWNAASKYTDNKKMYDDRIVPMSYISRRLIATSAFRLDRMGATFAIKRAVQNLIDEGQLKELDKQTVFNKYGSEAKCYAITRPDRFATAPV